MGRLFFLLFLILLALVAFLVVRAKWRKGQEREVARGYYVQQYDIDGGTVIRIARHGLKGRVEAVIPLDDPLYSTKLFEEYAKAAAKAEDWNSTQRALT
jgi:hypothetical protein